MITSDATSTQPGKPTRVRGLFQAHGVFFAVNPDTLTITHVSDNTARHIGIEPSELLGQSLDAVFDTSPFTKDLGVFSETGDQAYPTRALIGERHFDVISRRSGSHLFVELEPHLESDDAALALVRNVMRTMATAHTLNDLWGRVADGVRHITGYDRVNVSYFLPDGNGEVVATAQHDEMESHVGLHFPASNIPDEPSTNFRLRRSRLIANRLEPSVDLLVDPSVLDADDIDLSAAALVAPSARDLRLIERLGHVSTFSLAIVRNGMLVGIITCAHREQRRLSYSLRDGLELVADQLSLQLGAMQQIQHLRQRELLRETSATLESQLTGGGDIPTTLLHRDVTLLDLIPADGAAVRVGGKLDSIGDVPSAEVLARLPEVLAECAVTGDFSSDVIPVEFPALAARMPGFAGVLVRRLGVADYLAWFRRESAITVDWIRDLSSHHETPDTRIASLRDGDGRQASGTAPWIATESEASALGRAVESALLNVARSELAELAVRDSLTGLPNRRALIESLSARLSANLTSERTALLFVDVDHFKSINDLYGHAAGDSALIRLAHLLRDTAREGDLVARLGGDEFVVLVDGVNQAEAEHIGSRIIEAVRAAPADAAGWRLTTSVGLTIARSGQDVSEVLREADAAMYRAKVGGRDRTSL